MRTRRILALLVVLALCLAGWSIPAGSAMLQQPQDTVGAVSSGPSAKDGEGEDVDGGDDDRWGNTNPVDGGGGGSDDGGAVDNEDEFGGNARLLGNMDVLRIELRALFGFLVILL
ncbi:MAG: hypothetical protein JXA57_03780 [Armatimonadetes bacterium]|nr:hypothetical protein [Armatimonadota bacterium]